MHLGGCCWRDICCTQHSQYIVTLLNTQHNDYELCDTHTCPAFDAGLYESSNDGHTCMTSASVGICSLFTSCTSFEMLGRADVEAKDGVKSGSSKSRLRPACTNNITTYESGIWTTETNIAKAFSH